VRRANGRRREVHDESFLATRRDPAPGADVALDDERARRLLDDVLDRLPMDLRAVFVLAELEELTMATIAELLELPPGTVASRLRRARERFAEEAARVRAQLPRGAAR
jgi:RNA polymerase sigma-70 factor (ECF subfamily)